MKICVFCASSTKIHSQYFEQTKLVAQELVNGGHSIVYGGGSVGLMGCLADQALAMGGEVIGVLPRFMDQVEWGHKKLTQMILVEDMRERKKRMIEGVDAVLALPGGTGTLEELLEVFTLKRLGKFTQPIIVLNTNGFYEHLMLMVDRMVDEQFLRPEHKQMWQFVDAPNQIIPTILSAPKWGESAINFAAV